MGFTRQAFVRLLGLIPVLGLVTWLALDGSPRDARIQGLNLALRDGTIGGLTREQATRLTSTLRGYAAATGRTDEIALNEPYRPGRLHVYTTTPAAERYTGIGHGNAAYDADLDAIFIDTSFFDESDYRAIYDASGVSAVLEFGNLPFAEVYMRFVLFHELGHWALHRDAARTWGRSIHSLGSEGERAMERDADEHALTALQVFYRWNSANAMGLVGPMLADAVGISEFFGPTITDDERVWVDVTGMLFTMSMMNLFISTPYSPFFESASHPTFLDRARSLLRTVLENNALQPALRDHFSFFTEVFTRQRDVSRRSFVEILSSDPINDFTFTTSGALLMSVGNRGLAHVPNARLSQASRGQVIRAAMTSVENQEEEADHRPNDAIWSRPDGTTLIVDAKSRAWIVRGDDRAQAVLALPPPFTLGDCLKVRTAPQPAATAAITTCASDHRTWLHLFQGDRLLGSKSLDEMAVEVTAKLPNVAAVRLEILNVTSTGEVELTVETRGDTRPLLIGVATFGADLRSPAVVPFLLPQPQDQSASERVFSVAGERGRRYFLVGNGAGAPPLHAAVWEVGPLAPRLLATFPYMVEHVGEAVRPDLIANFDPYFGQAVMLAGSDAAVTYNNDSVYLFSGQDASFTLLFHPWVEEMQIRAGADRSVALFYRGGRRVFVFKPTAAMAQPE